MADQQRTQPLDRSRLLLYGLVALLVAVIAGLSYYSYRQSATLKRQSGGQGVSQVASSQAGQPEKIAELEKEVGRLKDALATAESGRDALQAQVAACGTAGCQALAEKLATSEKQIGELERKEKELRSQVAALKEENRTMRDRIVKEFSGATGQKLILVEIARMGSLEIGSFAPTEQQLAELRQDLAPYKSSPLLVVGIADYRPYKGPSADLKQLGLMLARARLVKEMGYEVYYQVRQNDPSVPESRGIIVYQMSMKTQTASAESDGRAVQAITPFYTAE